MNFFAGAYFDSSSKKRKILLFFLDNLQSSVTLINDESMSHCAGDVMIHKQSLKTKVKEYILELIREKELKAGDRLPPQRELARICGSSPKIAEIALSEMEAEGVIFRQVGRGSFLLDPLKTESYGAPKNVFVLVPNLRNPQFSEFVSEIESCLRKEELHMRLASYEAYPDDEALRLLMVEEGCSGIIGIALSARLLAFARNFRIPHVQLILRGRSPVRGLGKKLIFDLPFGMQLLADHLYQLGHRSFYLCGSDPENPSYRFEYMQKLLEKRGGKAKIIPQHVPFSSPFDYQEVGERLAEAILNDGMQGTVAVFYNAIRALGAMKHFLRRGIQIPQALSICGIDDILAAHMVDPELTTVNGRYLEAAHLAVQLLVAKEEENRRLFLRPRLLPGRSTGLSPAAAPGERSVERRCVG